MRHRTIRRPLGVIIPAFILAACAGQRTFVPPAPPPQLGTPDQIRQAKELAMAAQRAEMAKKTDEAISLYKQALDSYRDFPAVWTNLGLLQLEKGETLEAKNSFKMAGDLDPKDPRPIYNIGAIYEEQRWYSEAQKYYIEALARDANYHEALLRSVYLDMLQNTYTPATLDRTRRAMLTERDPTWRSFLERTQLRLVNELSAVSKEGGALVVPESDTHQQRP